MSFYRIHDASKRDAIVSDYLKTLNRLKEKDLENRMIGLNRQQIAKEAAHPIIESNEKSTNVITNELKPIQKEIADLNKNLTKEKTHLPILHARKRAATEDLFDGDSSRPDMYYGIQRDEKNRYILGDKIIDLKNNFIFIDEMKYEITPGLNSLIMDVNPSNFTSNDFETYTKIAIQTNLYNHPNGLRSNSSPMTTKKYKIFLEQIKSGRMVTENTIKEGTGVQFLPSSKDELIQKLHLLLAEFYAGNTTTRSELVALLDCLLEKKYISEKLYTKYNDSLSKKRK